METILVIVPAYNEDSNIGKTVDNLKEIQKDLPSLDICVVNDGSSDRTSDIVREKRVTLLNLPFNLGIGGAMQTGYKYAVNKGYDLVIQFDADGQHGEKDLKRLIAPIKNKEADLVIGSRFLNRTPYKGSTSRRIGIYYFSKLLLSLSGIRVTDPTSGYRAMNRKVMAYFASYYPKDYPEPEVIMGLKRRKCTLKEVSVHMNERKGGHSSITPMRSIYYMFKVSLSILIQKLKRV